MAPKIINLDVLLDERPRVMLFGQEHVVMPVDGKSYHLLSSLTMDDTSDKNTLEYITALYAIARRCIPTLTDEESERLTPDQIRRIVKVASNNLEEVEEEIARAQPAAEGNETGP